MPHNVTRRHFSTPVSADPPNAPAQLDSLFNQLASVATLNFGTRAARPSVANSVAGDIYWLTDDLTYSPAGSPSYFNGTTWIEPYARIKTTVHATSADNHIFGQQTSPGQVMAGMTYTGTFSGAPVLVSWHAVMGQGNSSAGQVYQMSMTPGYDGTTQFPGFAVDELVELSNFLTFYPNDGNARFWPKGSFIFTPPAGVHTIDLRAWNPAGVNWWVWNRWLSIAELV